MADDKKSCFVISPIGESGSEVRKRADLVLKHILRPVLEEDYAVVRADQISEPGLITGQVIQNVLDADLVVADLTGRNPNVFYELAIRHIVRKPLIQFIDKKEQMAFDVADTRTIQFDITDLDSVEAAKVTLLQQVKALNSDSFEMVTPISVTLDLKALKESKDPKDQTAAEVLQMFNEVNSNVARLEARLSGVFHGVNAGMPTGTRATLIDPNGWAYSKSNIPVEVDDLRSINNELNSIAVGVQALAYSSKDSNELKKLMSRLMELRRILSKYI